MSIEAMKLALEALEEINKLSIGEHAICLPAEIDTAMDALSQAIEQAEKQEQKVDWEKLYRLEVKKKEALAAKYERDIKPLTRIVPMAQPEQAQKQTDWEQIAKVQNAKLMAMCDEKGGFEKLCEVMDRYEAQKQEPVNKYCCHLCFKNSGQMFLDRMILCPECGNKRCPKATHHELQCTNSNEPNQTGSVHTTPPHRQWVGLTDEEMEEVRKQAVDLFVQEVKKTGIGRNEPIKFGRLVEAKLKQKNGF